MKLDVNILSHLSEFDLDVSFSITQGTLGILGASGCGKTMTLKSIAGIHTPDQGRIEWNKMVMFDTDRKIDQSPQKRRVGYLFQNYALFPNMTVEENIKAGLKKNQSKEIGSQMIEKFSLQGLEKRYPNQLSGGEQQRVALARILAYEPDILLLDEPFSAMDSHLKEKLRFELKKVLDEYKGISIMVSHDRDEVYQFCDQLMLMDKGKVIRFGPTKEVFENPRHVIAARLTGCKNISRIEIIDQTHVQALDWNDLILEVNSISENVTHIGIRAHDFVQCDNDLGINSFSSGKCVISQMPFEWHVTFENGLWWKTEKSLYSDDATNLISKYYSIEPDKILLLSDK